MSTEAEQSVIDQFAAAAKTPFGTLNPARVVARTMPLLHQLHLEHHVSWQAIGRLFNEGMKLVEGKTLPSTSLCRLYNLELKRERLRCFERQAAAGRASLPDQTQAYREPQQSLARSQETLDLHPTNPEFDQQRTEPELNANRARDGPQYGPMPETGAGPIDAIAKVRATLQDAKNLQKVRQRKNGNG